MDLMYVIFTEKYHIIFSFSHRINFRRTNLTYIRSMDTMYVTLHTKNLGFAQNIDKVYIFSSFFTYIVSMDLMYVIHDIGQTDF